MAEKRGLSPEPEEEIDGDTGAIVVAKKPRTEGGAIVLGHGAAPARTSGLAAPIMQLSGHGGEVYSLRFSPDGQALASASFDRCIYLWRVYDDECQNYCLVKGHKNAVLEVHWFQDGETLLSCSADKTVRCWDAEAGVQVKKVAEHTGVVNSCCPLRRGPKLFVSGGDDAIVKVWDTRSKKAVQTLTDELPICAVAFADAGDQVYSGGLDNTIKVWDLRKGGVAMTLKGHSDSVTGLRVSPDGTHLLSNAMDNTLRQWDMRPFAPANRCTNVFTGHMHNFEKNLLRCDWSPDGETVTCGSADWQVYIWDVASQKLLYKLPGHTGSVNEVAFHPKEPIVGSAASDKTIFLGELVK